MLKLALFSCLVALVVSQDYVYNDEEVPDYVHSAEPVPEVAKAEPEHPAPEAPVYRPYGFPYVHPYVPQGHAHAGHYPYFYPYAGYPGYGGYPGYHGYGYPYAGYGYAGYGYPHHAPHAAPHPHVPGVLVYMGLFKGTCHGAPDGLYYVNDSSFAFCSNGIKTLQACAEGAANPAAEDFVYGHLYHYGDFCSVNLADVAAKEE